MPKVSDLAAMYGKPPPNTLPTKSSPARQWTPSAVVKPSAISKLNNTGNATDTVPEWKKQLQQRKEALKKQEAQRSDSTDAVLSKTNTEAKTNGEAEVEFAKSFDADTKKNYLNKSDNSWRKSTETGQKPVSSTLYKQSTPPWKNNTTTNSNSVLHTSPKKNFLEQNKKSNIAKSNYEKSSFQSEPNKIHPQTRSSSSSFLHDSKRTGSVSSRSSSISDTEKFAGKQENSFANDRNTVPRNSQDFSSDRAPPPDEKDSSPSSTVKDRHSFLHRSVSNNQPGDKPERQRLPLPPFVYNQSPPEKPRKPYGARLPPASTNNDIHPSSQLQSSANDRPPLSLPAASTSPKTSNPSAAHRSGSFLDKQQRKESSSGPPLPVRNSSNVSDPNRPRALPDRPLHPLPVLPNGSGSNPPSLPERTPPPPPRDTSSRLPEVPRTERSLPSFPRDGPPLPSAHEPPPLPPPNTKKGNRFSSTSSTFQQDLSTPAIPTWDEEEEEEGDVTYDLPPEKNNNDFGPPSLPNKVPDIIPTMDSGEEDDVYMDTETPPSLPGPSNPNLAKEEKKKEIDKKEREMRRKFKLPLEGEIPAQSVGNIKSDSKWLKKFAVHANEEIDVIRTNDNPKGKWLIRNKKGIYGYIDSDNIELSMDHLRQVMLAMGPKSTAPAAPQAPSVRSYPSLEEETVYNAADEDEDDESAIYQEL